MPLTRDNIQFPSGSGSCVGWFYQAEGEAFAPCIIMAHGFGGIKEFRLDAYAERFCAAGYNVLVFDYRHFGESSGTPRQLLDIKKQHEDWRAALRFTQGLTNGNSNKIVLWGTSFSGGHVLKIANENQHVAAVISQVPHTDGFVTTLDNGLKQNVMLGIAALKDVRNNILGQSPYYVNTVGDVGELAAMTGPGECEKYRKLYPKELSVDERVAARVFMSVGSYSPGKYAAKLSMPLLVQVALNDITTPPKPAIAAAKKAPKGELITYELGHFDVYVEPAFEKTIADQLEFLARVV